MVSPVLFLPLVIVVPIIALGIGAGASKSVNRRLTRIAIGLFSGYLSEDREDRKQLLRSAFVAETYRSYAAKTILYTLLSTITGGIIAAYLVGIVTLSIPTIGDFISGLPQTINAVLGYPSEWTINLSIEAWAVLLLGSGVFGGLITGSLTYTMRWQMLESRAEARRRRINESLARTVAFLYALSRGGMPFPAVMQTLAENRQIYGETADEISVAVREMDLFGTDVITSINKVSERTPSEEFKTFGENLASVLQSGQRLPRFLNDQYDRYQEEAEERQEEILELLATIAEAYVTVLVAGTLFLITVLLVFGLTTTDTLWILQILGYLMIPLANIGFVVFVDQRLELLGVGSGGTISKSETEDKSSSASQTPATESTATTTTADGGHIPSLTANFERLEAYDRLAGIRHVVQQPFQTVLSNPASLLYLTVPIAIVSIVVRFPAALTGVGVNMRVLDDLLVQAALFVLGTYAIVRLVYKRRLKRIESATPEFLERLASLNEAGMSVVESFDRVRGSDLGALSEEVERIWADVTIGATIDEALQRFGNRIRTVPITRAVTLLSNAMRASGNVGDVLRIAATQARADLRMKRKRRQQMLTYLVVIYVSFAVFLVIIVAVKEVLVPSLPNSVPTPETSRLGVSAKNFARLGGVNKAAYTLVFFHTALIQAVASGLIGGQLGEGAVRDGVKHAALLLGIAYTVFILLSAPVASMSFQDQQIIEPEVTIESVSMSDGGFVVLHLHSADGPVIGRSAYLPAGKSTDVRIPVGQDLPGEATVVAVPHRDTNNNRKFDFNNGSVDRIYPPNKDAVVARAKID